MRLSARASAFIRSPSKHRITGHRRVPSGRRFDANESKGSLLAAMRERLHKRPVRVGISPMFDAVTRRLFDVSGLMPHSLWQPGLIEAHALSDAGIGLAYFSIAVALAVIARL